MRKRQDDVHREERTSSPAGAVSLQLRDVVAGGAVDVWWMYNGCTCRALSSLSQTKSRDVSKQIQKRFWLLGCSVRHVAREEDSRPRCGRIGLGAARLCAPFFPSAVFVSSLSLSPTLSCRLVVVFNFDSSASSSSWQFGHSLPCGVQCKQVVVVVTSVVCPLAARLVRLWLVPCWSFACPFWHGVSKGSGVVEAMG